MPAESTRCEYCHRHLESARFLRISTKAFQTPAGASPARNFADIAYIATFIRRCDVVAVQEVRGNLRALRYLLKELGDDWGGSS